MKLKKPKTLESNSLGQNHKRIMKTLTLEQVKTKFIGNKGTTKRNTYEAELSLDLIGETIRKTRIRRKLTQQQLGELVGVQKAQISKIENNFKDTRLSTIMKVFNALDTKILVKVEAV